MSGQARNPGDSGGLAAFLRSHRDEVLSEWAGAVRALPRAAALPEPKLVDAVPFLLDSVAGMVDRLAAGADAELPAEIAEEHAVDRLEEGFDLAEVVLELSLLRDCVLELWERRRPERLARGEERALSRAIDRVTMLSVDRFSAARERLLTTLDRISAAALEAQSLEEFLGGLVATIREETPSVDTATIFLLDGDLLRIRASAGLPESATREPPLRLGEGFAGRIAAECRPLVVPSAATDPLVTDPSVRALGIRALYGVALVHEGRVLGIARMGSLTADAFTRQDKFLLRSMASRATAGIYQHMLREELDSSKRTLEALVDHMPVGVSMAVPPHGRIAIHNQEAVRLLGHPVLATESYEQYAKYGAHHPDGSPYRPEEYPTVRALFQGECVRDEEMRYVRGDGRETIFQIRAAPVRGPDGNIVAAVTTFWDIEEAKRAEEVLRRSEESLRQTTETLETIVRGSPLPIVAIDLEQRVEIWNPAAERLFGWREADVLGSALPVIPHEERREFERLTRAVQVRGAPVAVEVQRKARDGSVIDISLWAAPRRNAAGKITGTIAVLADLSETRRTRRELEEALRRAEEAIRTREDVLAIVSHDLRNPLGTIDLNSVLLLRHAALHDAPSARKIVETIRKSTRRAAHLLDDLLDMSRIQAGRLSLEREVTELAPILVEAVESHEPLAAEKGIELRSDFAVVGVFIDADRQRILQVLSNLVGNAVKFCRAGDTVTVRARLEGGEVRISVADTGPGIPAEELGHLFEPYWSGRPGRTSAGLGLFISRGLIESHDGRLWVESEVGQGSTFFFALPRAKVPQAKA